MIAVIASIKIKPNKKDKYLDYLKNNLPLVHSEEGCIEYLPVFDFESGISAQEKDDMVITILEKWESIEHLKAHSIAAHMKIFKEQVKDCEESVTLKVLQEI